jgi:hypothetical protein
MRIAGIDPGLSGAVACIGVDDNHLVVVDLSDIPTLGDAAKRELDDLSLIGWLKEFKPDHVYLENVRAMPSLPGADGERRSMGAVSAFKFGFVAGQIRTCVRGCKVPFTLVEPVRWKRATGLKGGLEGKEQARQAAIRLFPDAHGALNLKRHHNRAEALLLARYGILHGDHAAKEAAE